MSQNMSPTLNKLELEAIPVELRTVETTAETVAETTAETATATAVMNPDFHPDTFRVDRYAERLIDEVFFNVDHLLETGESLDPEPQPEPDSAGTDRSPETHFAEASFAEAMAGSRISFTTLPQLDAPLSVVPDGTLAQSEVKPSPVTLVRPDRTLRLLCGLALASLVGAIAMVVTQWPSYRTLLDQLTGQAATQTLATAPAAQPESGTVLSPNAQFADYVQRSLNVLKDQTALNQTTGQMAIASPPALLQVPPAAIQPIASLPTLPVTPLAPMAPPATAPGTIIERIYIPVYQTPNGYVPVDPNTKISAEVAAAGVIRTNPQPASQPVSPASSQPSQRPVSQPAPTPVASATQSTQPSAAPTPQAVQPVIQPVVQHTLVGLLELGNGSAALFAVDGVTRRLSLGERIGGWTIAEIKNGEATLRKDGEVRTVFVGQTF